jgi:hypothetical protein
VLDGDRLVLGLVLAVSVALAVSLALAPVESEAVAVALELGVTDGVPELLAVCTQHSTTTARMRRTSIEQQPAASVCC